MIAAKETRSPVWETINAMTTFNDVFHAAQGLPASDRLRLLESLYDSLSPNDLPSPSEEWIAESQRRSAEYDAGAASTSSWPEVKTRSRQRAGLDG